MITRHYTYILSFKTLFKLETTQKIKQKKYKNVPEKKNKLNLVGRLVGWLPTDWLNST